MNTIGSSAGCFASLGHRLPLSASAQRRSTTSSARDAAGPLAFDKTYSNCKSLCQLIFESEITNLGKLAVTTKVGRIETSEHATYSSEQGYETDRFATLVAAATFVADFHISPSKQAQRDESPILAKYFAEIARLVPNSAPNYPLSYTSNFRELSISHTLDGSGTTLGHCLKKLMGTRIGCRDSIRSSCINRR